MSKRVLIAVSGGMDSAVAAALLKTQGYDVTALHMTFWDKALAKRIPPAGSCCRAPDTAKVEKLFATLEIPLRVVDASEQYFGTVLDYVVHEYLSARLPNPCVLCNSLVKFDVLLKKADELRCDFIATGHYAKVVHSADGKEHNIYRAADHTRDQSYFLFTLSQKQLSRTLMPLGDLLESNVTKMARTFGVPVKSHGAGPQICFVDVAEYAQVVNSRTAERYRPGGPIVNREGQALGRHIGLHNYRIGQRNAPGVEKPEAFGLFVVGIDHRLNAVILGEEKDLQHSALIAADCSWIGVTDFTKGLHARVRIRSHQQDDVPCYVTLLANNSVMVEFEKPQIGVMPGQAAVFYREDVLIGGGWVETSTTPVTTKLSKRQAFVIHDPNSDKNKNKKK